MDNTVINTISLFSGVGMLDEGLHAGLGFLGIRSRTVMYAEREAYPVSVLEARMEEGSLPPAPVWFGDLCELDASQFHGVVDCIVAGFPCQDLSLAGRRAGLDGKRSGLFFEVVKIARDCGARYLFLENVAGIASATASVVDEAEGALDERAAARVLGELADLGWNAEWATISASDVGASHGRARWFCWAWREVGHAGWNAGSAEHGQQPQSTGGRSGEPGAAGDGAAMDDTQGGSMRVNQHHQWAGTGESDSSASAGDALGHTTGTRPQEPGQARERELPAQVATGLHHRSEQPGSEVGQPESFGRPAWGTEHAGQQGRTAFAVPGCKVGHTGLQHQHLQQWEDGAEHSGAGEHEEHDRAANGSAELADTSSTGHEGREQPGALHGNRGGEKAHGSTEQLCVPLFAPGPADPAWPGIIQQWPYLAPALEPSFHRMADGLAYDMDDCRPQRLKCCGNGVVAAQASFALVGLVRRMRK